jgi:Na+-driven multidrug efflux pump
MKDLTTGSVTRHLVHMSAFLAISMAVQTLYLLADLYWVGHLGKEAIAAVGVAGNITMIVLALTQMLGVGTTTLIAQAAGRKDQVRAGVQSIFRHVDRDCVRPRYCRISSAPGLL